MENGFTAGHTVVRSPALTYVDFCPTTRRDPVGWFFQATYENFSEVFGKVNTWLRAHPHWEAKSVETLYLDAKSSFGSKTSFVEAKSLTRDTRGIRLWVVPKPPENFIGTQKLGCINVVPKVKQVKKKEEEEERKNTSENGLPQFETLDEILTRINEILKEKPLEGRLLCAETVPIPVDGKWSVNTEVTHWPTSLTKKSSGVHILRVYFEYGPPKREVLEVKSFFPYKHLWDSPLAVPNFEPYSELLKKASGWFRDQPLNCRFLNVQTVEIPLTDAYSKNSDEDLGTKLTFKKYEEDFSVRAVRLFYARGEFKVTEEIRSKLKPTLLNCKIFVPSRCRHSSEYEMDTAVKMKLESWLTATKVPILCAETAAIKLPYTTSSLAACVDSTLTCLDSAPEGCHWITILRVYVNGHYLEPPSRLFPGSRITQEENTCRIS